MQRLTKGTEPPFLAPYRQTKGADWDRDVRGEERKVARKKLVAEQGHLCCFCEGRIEPEVGKIKIAHFVPQVADPTQMFSWGNLFGACMGGEKIGEKTPKQKQHCDTRQGSQRLDNRLRPTQIPKDLIRFSTSGKAITDDPQLQSELEHKLNLNLTRLVENRKAAWEAMVRAMDKGKWSPADVRHKIAELTDQDVVIQAEYKSYLLWWLERRLKSFV